MCYPIRGYEIELWKNRGKEFTVYTTTVFCDEHQLRPAAIIPWSQYQRRLGKVKEGSLSYQKESEPLTSSASHFGSYEREDLSPSQLPRFEENESEQRMGSKPRQYGNVIRPQIRGRLPADPSDFSSKYPKTNQVEYLVQRELAVPPERPHAVPKTKQQLPARIPLRIEQTQSRSEMQGMNKVASLAIPNGVPMTAGSWETGQPHYMGDRKLHAANTFAGSAASSFPYTNNLNGNELPTAPIYQKAIDSNIVSSIFSQSQARSGAIPTMVQTSQPQAYLEKFLTDGASLDQFSKLAKNLLGVGGGNGETGSGSGGLLETMTSVLSGSNRGLPTSSAAHDDLSQYTPSSARGPQTSVFQKLLSQATDALKDSWKQKEKETKEKTDLDAVTTKTDLFALPVTKNESPKKEKLSKDRENSIKLLENMPAEQRKMLEAAIMSGEIDADSPAIKNLVKNDLTEESKKEKENRLIEWIRANRPSKTSSENTIAKNVPYYGKYLGSLAETPTTKKQKSPAGALWLVDERRIIVTRFVFQSGSLLNENVTFWLGPKTPTGNFVEDFMPSENGFYVRPKPIELSAFATKELPPIEAKPRPNVAAVKLFEGLPPIVANVSRVKRNSDSNNEVANNGPTAKPIELFVEGGIMKVLPGNGKERSSSELGSQAVTPLSSLPDGFRLSQPEFDLIDDTVPQPLQWFEGFQPLMLTLPSSKVFSDIHWVSLRDHKRKANVASVILPNGPLVQIPKVIRLRALSPNSLAYNISSGPIEILDAKTIRINQFSFQHDDDSVWLMVGSELFPNMGGKIVPLFDESTKSFDCQALRSYHSETVIFRLPGDLTWKDVFWFSSDSVLFVDRDDVMNPTRMVWGLSDRTDVPHSCPAPGVQSYTPHHTKFVSSSPQVMVQF
uniref:DM13 domain-containing protein n=1 Tax=Caenorhabditis japonica TaxID=281687 RepID=A0A8R1DEV4_CAEJA